MTTILTSLAKWILLQYSISSISLVESLIQDGLSKFFGALTPAKHVKIPELLNQLCNESQGASEIFRDACYGCFFRASNQATGYPMLLAMSSCADTYLNNSEYAHCQQYLMNATTPLNARASPTVIYCTFLECIRNEKKNSLEALQIDPREVQRSVTLLDDSASKSPRGRSLFFNSRYFRTLPNAVCVVVSRARKEGGYTLRDCVGEAARMFPGFNRTDVQLAQLFVNTTACVLAKTRCSFTNPITGEIQDDLLASKLQIPTVNAILINTDYELNIVQFPFRSNFLDVCSKYRNQQQAGWPSVVCT